MIETDESAQELHRIEKKNVHLSNSMASFQLYFIVSSNQIVGLSEIKFPLIRKHEFNVHVGEMRNIKSNLLTVHSVNLSDLLNFQIHSNE